MERGGQQHNILHLPKVVINSKAQRKGGNDNAKLKHSYKTSGVKKDRVK